MLKKNNKNKTVLNYYFEVFIWVLYVLCWGAVKKYTNNINKKNFCQINHNFKLHRMMKQISLLILLVTSAAAAPWRSASLWSDCCGFPGCFTPGISIGFPNIWLVHIWHAECVKVQTQRFIHGLQSNRAWESKAKTVCACVCVRNRERELVSSLQQAMLLQRDLWVTTC